jgi:hypothetical protein
VIAAARKHDHTKNILLNSIDAINGVFKMYRVNTLMQTIRKKRIAVNAVAQYRAL